MNVYNNDVQYLLPLSNGLGLTLAFVCISGLCAYKIPASVVPDCLCSTKCLNSFSPRVFEGEWSHGLTSGPGVMRFQDGSFVKGTWTKGVLQREQVSVDFPKDIADSPLPLKV